MSSTLLTLIHGIVRSLLAPERALPLPLVSGRALLILGGTGIHGAYVFSTKKQENIYVQDTYQRVHHGYTSFMVIDGEGRHFNMANSAWFWKWNSIEDWHRIQRGYPLTVQYYGWRVPALGWFPNIVGHA
jgi:hypothetical protein